MSNNSAALCGHLSAVLVNQYNLSAFLNKFDSKMSSKVLDTTCFGDTAKRKTGSILDGGLSASGFYDNSAGGVDQVMRARIGDDTGQVVTQTIGTSTAGSRVRVALAKSVNLKRDSKSEDIIPLSFDCEPDGGVLGGDLIAPIAQQTLALLTTASIDCGISTTNGGLVNFHVLSISTGVTVDSLVLRHSADGVTWTALATIASAVAAAGGYQYEIPLGTTIEKQLSLVSTLTGTGAGKGVQYAVAVGRR